MRAVLVTGGAGYIGSHVCKALANAGYLPVTYDSLACGHASAVKWGPLEVGDIRDASRLSAVIKRSGVTAVIHLAAFAYVGESVTDPAKYYRNNVAGSLVLLEAMRSGGINRIVFSSTCATYGEPAEVPIPESAPQIPINPYGWSKLFSEQMLRDYGVGAPQFGYAVLRYFNVAGCSDDGQLGEDHRPETHLIPLLLQTALGIRPAFTVYGVDYPTADGTCVRDYIHVEDLVEAHVAVMEALKPGEARTYNLGMGRGYSVREIIDTVRSVIDVDFRVEVGPRRPGDPPSLYADASKITREVGWRAQRTDLSDTIRGVWRWLAAHPNGYPFRE